MQKRREAIAYLALLLGLLLTISSCAREPESTEDLFAERSGNYTATAKIAYKDLKAKAMMSQHTPASCAVVFESPASLQDMAFIFRKDSVDLNYKNLSFSFEQDSLPATAVARLAVAAVNRAMRDDGLGVALKDDALEIVGMLESGEFILSVNRETGGLMKLLIPAEELEIEFENFTFLD